MGDERRPYLPVAYVALWPHGMDRHGRQYAMMRGRCRLCGWRGKIRKTHDWERPERTRAGYAAARDAQRHFAAAHPGMSNTIGG